MASRNLVVPKQPTCKIHMLDSAHLAYNLLLLYLLPFMYQVYEFQGAFIVGLLGAHRAEINSTPYEAINLCVTWKD
uniref:Golgi SNARE 12 protein n=1 Tax=Arundo donax TaxID=35708 RepID=A0A0A9DEJ1_ARUDO